MKSTNRAWPVLVVTLLASLTTGVALLAVAAINYSPAPPGEFKVTLLHLNDTYEVTPLDHGRTGGLARVATLLKQLRHDNPATYALHAGDFLSPSALGAAVVSGKRLAGVQMVATLRAAGIDYITFGNHEFDLEKDEFDQRIKELSSGPAGHCSLTVLSDNVRDAKRNPFAGVRAGEIVTVRDSDDRPFLRIGLIALTMNTPKECDGYATFDDAISSAEARMLAWARSDAKPDSVIALTHESLTFDEDLARKVRGIDLIVGGHEHENTCRTAEPAAGATAYRVPPICRADANARTVYIHELVYDRRTKQLLRINSHLKAITEAIEEDPDTAKVVNRYVKQAFDAFRATGIDPDEKVGIAGKALDGTEASVRSRSTSLTDLIGEAMLRAPAGPTTAGRVVIYNAGSIRIDDRILSGPITMYDVLRVLPFGGEVWSVPVKGELLERILNKKDNGKGSGAFLQTRNVSIAKTAGKAVWLIDDKELQADNTYELIINDYLLNGREPGLELTAQAPHEGRNNLGDWRKVIRGFLRTVKEWPIP